MERERKQNGLVIALLLVTVLSLSVAFAATLSSTLTINGTATIGEAKWDVHFVSASTAADSELQATTGPTLSSNTAVTYAVTLEENKSYTMEVVVKNNGTYDAKLNKLTLSGAENYDFITYTVTGMEVGTDSATIDAGAEKTLTLTISMGTINNDNVADLENGLSLNLTASADFIQA